MKIARVSLTAALVNGGKLRRCTFRTTERAVVTSGHWVLDARRFTPPALGRVGVEDLSESDFEVACGSLLDIDTETPYYRTPLQVRSARIFASRAGALLALSDDYVDALEPVIAKTGEPDDALGLPRGTKVVYGPALGAGEVHEGYATVRPLAREEKFRPFSADQVPEGLMTQQLTGWARQPANGRTYEDLLVAAVESLGNVARKKTARE